MTNKKDNPGIVLPPPLIYAAVFFLSLFVQSKMAIDSSFFGTQNAKIAGYILIAISLFFIVPALIKFARSKNTLMTIRPASSLQITGIYAVSRNPMYMGLLILYSGIAFLKGNLWTFIFIPLIIIIMQAYVIRGEENYLLRAFGEQYVVYKKKVRRWI